MKSVSYFASFVLLVSVVAHFTIIFTGDEEKNKDSRNLTGFIAFISMIVAAIAGVIAEDQ